MGIIYVKRILFFILLLAFLYYVYMHISLPYVMITYWYITLILLFISVLFIFCKSYALYFSFIHPPTYKTCIQYFCTSTYVEVVTLTGKIGSDIAKYAMFSDIKTIFKFRITSILAMISMVCLMWVYTSIFIIPIAVFLWYKKTFYPYVAHIIGYVLTLGQAIIVLNILQVEVSLHIIRGYLVSYIAGIVSFIPFGIGIREAVMHFTLPIELQIILLASIWLRITSEFFTTVIGGIMSYAWIK